MRDRPEADYCFCSNNVCTFSKLPNWINFIYINCEFNGIPVNDHIYVVKPHNTEGLSLFLLKVAMFADKANQDILGNWRLDTSKN
jgi:hypothetical protein